MIPYSLHVALLLAVFLSFYKVFLRKLTYYGLNRWVLMACLGVAFLLPLVAVPEHLSLRKAEPVIVEQSAPAVAITYSEPALKAPAVTPAKHTRTGPLFRTENIVKWAMWLYWCGVIIFGANFLLQVITLLYQAYRNPVIRDGIYRIVELEGDKAPCSFANIIYINPARYDWDTYSQILLHEKVHVRNGHTIDLILAELVLILQWFNPFAWLYRKAIDANLEFLTDHTLVTEKGVEPENYQLNLLKVAAPNYALHITTNYNQSLLKKRILMMNAKQSNIHSSWKYLMLMPLAGVLAAALNQPTAASSPVKPTVSKPQPLAKPAIKAQEQPVTSVVKNQEKLAPPVEKVPETLKKDTTKKLTAKEMAELEEDGISASYVKSFVDIGYPGLTVETVKQLDGFDINANYVKALMDIKYDVSIPTLQGLMGFDITPGYIKALKEIKYDVSLPTLQALVGWDITPGYIKSLKDIKYDVSLPTLQTLTSLDITPGYIKQLQDIGYNDTAVETLKDLTSWDITPSYIKGFMDIGYKDVSVKTLVKFIGADITPSFVKGLKNYKGMTADQIIAASDEQE